MKGAIQKIGPVVWAIAGSDSGAGAGIQMDLKVAQALGVHASTVVTAITAQNPSEILGLELVSDGLIQAQLAALKAHFSPAAIKTGMLGSAQSIVSLAASLRALETFTVCDPVLTASSGAPLLPKDAIEAMKSSLFPVADLLTPNLPEAEILLDRVIQSPSDIEQAARDLLSFGAKQVLLKGGHSRSDFASDYWTDGAQGAWLHSPRRPSPRAHGTGCLLSSAIAVAHAQGLSRFDALCLAKAFLNRALRLALRVAGGSSVLFTQQWPSEASAEDMPWLAATADPRRDAAFPDCGPDRIGFYPVVDRAAWVERLLPCGVTTIQLRVKDLRGEELEREVRLACDVARRHHARLFVNDYWELARKHGAFGVHLGQEDLVQVDIDELRKSGLRLGVSTHSYAEVARALVVRPSYVAVGPVFPTTLKQMAYPPQGLEGVRRWRALLDCPLVAIGGISLERASEISAAGAEGISVVSDLTRSENPEARARAWVELLAV